MKDDLRGPNGNKKMRHSSIHVPKSEHTEAGWINETISGTERSLEDQIQIHVANNGTVNRQGRICRTSIWGDTRERNNGSLELYLRKNHTAEMHNGI